MKALLARVEHDLLSIPPIVQRALAFHYFREDVIVGAVKVKRAKSIQVVREDGFNKAVLVYSAPRIFAEGVPQRRPRTLIKEVCKYDDI